MPLREGVTRTTLKVHFEMLRLFDCLECHVQLDFPRTKLGGVRTFPGIMIGKPLTEVGRMPYVAPVRITQTFDHVCVEHGLPSIAWNRIRAKSSFAKPTEDILRLKPSLIAPVPSEGWWRRRVTLPLGLACRASASLLCHTPF